MSHDEPLSVVIPPPERDRPAWARVGLVAGAGFVIGVAWPQLTGAKLAPSPPGDAAPAVTAVATVEPARPSASASPVASAAAAAKPAAPSSAEPSVAVGPGTIVRCRDAKGRAREECGALAIDALALPRLEGLAKCPAAARAEGKLPLGLDVDFKRKVVHVQRGKGTSLPRATRDALLACAASAFAGVSLDGVEHAHARYTVLYAATFTPAAGADGAARGPSSNTGATSTETPATGTATVAFDTAVVRDAPKGQGVVGRVLRGARVKLLGRQGEWYRVSFGATPREGWMHRSALGL